MLLQADSSNAWLSPQALAAGIAAMALLIVTVLQLYHQRKNAREIERLRVHLQTSDQVRVDYLRQYLELYAQGHEHELEAFRESLRNAQVVRDRLRRLADYPSGIERKAILKELASLADLITDTYGRNQVHFSESDREVAHSLKRHSIHAIETVRQAIQSNVDSGRLSEIVPGLVAPVTEAQNKLRIAATAAAQRTYDDLRAGVNGNVR